VSNETPTPHDERPTPLTDKFRSVSMKSKSPLDDLYWQYAALLESHEKLELAASSENHIAGAGTQWSLEDRRDMAADEYDEPGIAIGAELPGIGFVSIASVVMGCEEAKALGTQEEIAQRIVNALNAASSEKLATQRSELAEWSREVRLVIRGIDGQAEKILGPISTDWKVGDEEIIVGYKLKTGLWHRLLGLLASCPASEAPHPDCPPGGFSYPSSATRSEKAPHPLAAFIIAQKPMDADLAQAARKVTDEMLAAAPSATRLMSACEVHLRNEFRRLVNKADELTRWLSKMIDAGEVEIKCTDIGAEGTTERLKKLDDIIRQTRPIWEIDPEGEPHEFTADARGDCGICGEGTEGALHG